MTKIRNVLIIEDDSKVRTDIKRAFRVDDEFEFAVTGVATVEEANRIMREEKKRFDLLVIDWRLEHVKDGGLKILLEGKKYFPKIKIVYTAYATIENCVKAVKSGADDYIDKSQSDSLEKLRDSAKEKLRARQFEEHEPDSEWLNEHLVELKEKYYGELIAFIEGKVVDHASTEQELIEKVKKKYPDKEPFIMFAPVEVI